MIKMKLDSGGELIRITSPFICELGAKKNSALHCSRFNRHLITSQLLPILLIHQNQPLENQKVKIKNREVVFYETSPKMHSLWTFSHVVFVLKTHKMRKNRLQKPAKKYFGLKTHILKKNWAHFKLQRPADIHRHVSMCILFGPPLFYFFSELRSLLFFFRN